MGEIIQQQDSRRVFINTLIELAEKDDKIILITCDVGFNYIEKFQEKFPYRFFNFGVTEATTTIIASAMSRDGWRPYFYSMIPFVAFRPFEMIRNAVLMNDAKFILLGTKGSEKYKMLGRSHNMAFENEDEYHLKPYMKCYLPQSNKEVQSSILDSYKENKPAYIRL